MHYIKDISLMFLGAVAASFFEYYLKYNLFDLLKDKISSLIHKKKSA